ncbi:MAG: hypothetical protein JSR31_15010 [Nitrospira sp.]|nr:hypothetical protein [Nitrospira sp.]
MINHGQSTVRFFSALYRSGPVGQRAAIQAATLGKRVGLVEHRRIMGGVFVETGTIPSKTFRKHVIRYGRQIDHDGLLFSEYE